MAVLSLILVAVGTALIITGAVISVADWKKKRAAAADEVETETAGVGEELGEALNGLAKLAEALRDHPLGMQLMVMGIAVVIIGGVLGGLSGL